MKVVESVVENKKETGRDLTTINNEYSQYAGLLGDRIFKQFLFEQEVIGFKEKMTELNKEATQVEALKRRVAKPAPEAPTAEVIA